MLPRHASAILASAFALAIGLSVAPARAAAPKDAQAENAIAEALEVDFLETKFDRAEQRLRSSIDTCGDSGCTPSLKAKLYAALGSVLAGGKKQLEDAREAFVQALMLDKAVQLNPDIASTEVKFAFEQAQKQLKLDKPPKPEKPVEKPPEKPVKPKAVQCIDDGECNSGLACVGGECIEKAADPTPKAQEKSRKNWITLSFAPDVSVVSGADVCTRENQDAMHFVCVRQDGTRYLGKPTIGNADNIRTGPALSTLRVLLTYERVVADNVGLGARIGFAFNGATDAGASFLPLHLEGRVAYSIGKKPYDGKGVRPFFFVSGGLAQVDTKVEVQVLEDAKACGKVVNGKCSNNSGERAEPQKQTLSAYKQAGQGFAGGGFGLAYMPVAGFSLNLGIRASATFPVVTFVMAPEAGLSLGF
jgi:hypothetical protein